MVDEQLPVQLLPPLLVCKGHEFVHVDSLKWKSKEDKHLFRDAAKKGFEAIITADKSQLYEREEIRALRASGLHYVGLKQGRKAKGVAGAARRIASLVAAMPYVASELEVAKEPMIVEISMLSAKSRHASTRLKTWNP